VGGGVGEGVGEGGGGRGWGKGVGEGDQGTIPTQVWDPQVAHYIATRQTSMVSTIPDQKSFLKHDRILVARVRMVMLVPPTVPAPV